MILLTSRWFPWLLVVVLAVGLGFLLTRPSPAPASAPVATATAAANATAAATTSSHEHLTVTVPPSATATKIEIDSSRSSAVQADVRAAAEARIAAPVAKKNWAIGLSARFRPDRSGIGRPTAYDADLAGRIGGSPLFGVLGVERDEQGRLSLSLGVRYEF